MKLLAVISLVLLILTMGCGFAIHYGGESFRDAIKGHMVLGILTLGSVLILVFKVLRST